MLNQLASKIRRQNQQKGFDLSDVQTGTQLMLVVSELSEALEAFRRGRYCNKESVQYLMTTDFGGDFGKKFQKTFENDVKDTFEDELADALIRILDICAFYEIDIDSHVSLKLQYNATREHKHGKKF